VRQLFIRSIAKILRQRRKMNLMDGVIPRSICMGMVVGFSPTIGLQMVICVVLSFLVNRFWRPHTFNVVIALIGSLVVNPLTMVPTYTLYYVLGCEFITCSAAMEFESAGHIETVLLNFGEGSLAILIGSLPFMVVGFPVGYWLGWLIERFLLRRAARKRERLVAMAKQRRENQTHGENQTHAAEVAR